MRVKAKNPETVALWERNIRHPGGEVFITGHSVFDVAETDAVVSRLKSGVLVEVKPAPRKTPPAKAKRSPRKKTTK